MSRRKDNYENSRWLKFKRWVDGEIDPLAEGMETRAPEAEAAQEPGQEPASVQPQPQPSPSTAPQSSNPLESRGIRRFRRFYQVMSVLLCFSIIFVLLWTIAYLPVFGNAGNPDNNEVSARYIESGLKETGAVNIVTGMILDYRAFDTFGESCVLFIASCCVLALLRIDKDSGDEGARKRLEEANDRLFEPKNDVILQKCACILVPLILIFGIYIVLNGHLSPGGGFSGGAVLGSGLILYLNAFGFQKTEQFFTEKVYRRITLGALSFYCLAKSYSFFTGANHLKSGIPLGTPGAILSSGLILPLNICVGLVVACTLYAFYTLFRKGGM
ncbi:hydrogen gas-evolving membrane-bound hydrogenase subunit E [Clostridium sp. AN503]|uniref:hydrogen gas-evolving membrane-bound hydrogenase subunit E n=1 Tax=Clostridium sp. AN503 TaxID=3160598 RepID=UPI00345843C4